MSQMPPKVFISYSWDSDAQKEWVASLASRLRGDGLDVELDQWGTVPGDKLPEFMERAIRENKYVVIICTANYKRKSDARQGGVGYEGDIMTGEVLASRNNRKFIPVLREGTFGTHLPTWLSGSYGINLAAEPYSEESYKELVNTLHDSRSQAPPIGRRPVGSTPRSSASRVIPSQPLTEWEPIKIVGVIVDEIGEPRNDGSRGSSLYPVPFRLTRVPSIDWVTMFISAWNNPPEFTTSHRPGIARIRRDRVILEGTTVEEVRDVHRKTLRLAVDVANAQFEEQLKRTSALERAKQWRRDEHEQNFRKIADDIVFD